MHADKVGLRQQCIHSPKFHLQLFLHLFCRAHRIRVNHLHLETACAPRHRWSNPPESHNAQRLPPHIAPHQLLQVPVVPVSRPRQRFCSAQPPRQRHSQGPCRSSRSV